MSFSKLYREFLEQIEETEFNEASAYYAHGSIDLAYEMQLISKQEWDDLNKKIPLTPAQLEKINF